MAKIEPIVNEVIRSVGARENEAIENADFENARKYVSEAAEHRPDDVEGLRRLAKIDELAIILLSIVALFAVGLWDDKKHLGPFFNIFGGAFHLVFHVVTVVIR